MFLANIVSKSWKIPQKQKIRKPRNSSSKPKHVRIKTRNENLNGNNHDDFGRTPRHQLLDPPGNFSGGYSFPKKRGSTKNGDKGRWEKKQRTRMPICGGNAWGAWPWVTNWRQRPYRTPATHGCRGGSGSRRGVWGNPCVVVRSQKLHGSKFASV